MSHLRQKEEIVPFVNEVGGNMKTFSHIKQIRETLPD
jgi:hypothetical protein